MSPLLRELGELCHHAGKMAQDARESIDRELKKDGTIVTAADRAVERFLRKELPQLVPGSTVWGEEYGFEEEGPGGLWAVDPIDGTSNYSFGSPLWGVSIGLVVGENVELGAVYLPDLGETYLGERGKGACCNFEWLSPIAPAPIREEELVSYGEWILRDYGSRGLPGRMRLSGSFVVDGCFVACQRFRGLIGMRERLYDVAATVLFAQELGAEVRYANGEPFDIPSLKNGRIATPWIIFPAGTSFRL